jgi:ammonia channel protein AmtB
LLYVVGVLLDFRIVQTLWYFAGFLLDFGIVQTLWYFVGFLLEMSEQFQNLIENQQNTTMSEQF